MAKKRSRGAAAEPSRAALKALERRTAQSVASTLPAAPRPQSAPPVTTVEPSPGPAAARRGVLPPRGPRFAVSAPALTREEELRYVVGDLRRLTVLAVIMVAFIVALAFIVPALTG